MCERVDRRIFCNECGYPPSEARYCDDADQIGVPHTLAAALSPAAQEKLCTFCLLGEPSVMRHGLCDGWNRHEGKVERCECPCSLARWPRLSPAPAPLEEVLEQVLVYLAKPGDGSAEVCNLWEQVHTLMGCEECQHRWEGTTFKATGESWKVSALSPQVEDHGFRIQCPFCRRWTNHLNEDHCGWCQATLIRHKP